MRARGYCTWRRRFSSSSPSDRARSRARSTSSSSEAMRAASATAIGSDIYYWLDNALGW